MSYNTTYHVPLSFSKSPYHPFQTPHHPWNPTVYCSLFTIYCLLFTAHYPPPTTHRPPPTTHYPLPTTHCPPPTTHYPPTKELKNFSFTRQNRTFIMVSREIPTIPCDTLITKTGEAGGRKVLGEIQPIARLSSPSRITDLCGNSISDLICISAVFC
jgi:hypothetical protein